MLTVKFTPYRQSLGAIYARQTPSGSLMSRDGRYRFVLDDSIREADFWVVQGKGIRQPASCRVAPENTLMFATEPPSVLVYPKKYLRQFGHAFTCQEAIGMLPNEHSSFPLLPWFVGFSEQPDRSCSYSLDYDQLKAMPLDDEKPKLISVITSNKAFTRGHLDRIRFVQRLKEHFGNRIDVFGRGFNGFADKWDVLRPYRYHIAIENSSQPYYWTEKISDCYLAGCFPFYHGCTNLADYFPQDAFCPIDIRKPDEAIHTIELMLQQDVRTQRSKAMAESRRLVLDVYNMFEHVARVCDSLNPGAPKQEVTIKPCQSGRQWHNMRNYLFTRNYYQVLNLFK